MEGSGACFRCMGKSKAFEESKLLSAVCLNHPDMLELTDDERNDLSNALEVWVIGCRYRELYRSNELMLRHAVMELAFLRGVATGANDEKDTDGGRDNER